MTNGEQNKCCDTCDHFAEYTEDYAVRSGYDGCCMFGTIRCFDRPCKKSSTCDFWKPMHDTPCCDNCLHVVDVGGGGNLICGVGVPIYVKVNGLPTEAYKCAGQCFTWASKWEKCNDPLLRYIRRF